MEMNIVYADDDAKKQKLVDYVKEHPGVPAYQILKDLCLCNRVYHYLLKDLLSSGQITLVKGQRGALYHYCN